MAQRTIYECDRCHAEFCDHKEGEATPWPAQWSITQRLGVIVFILCVDCTHALREFLGLPEPVEPNHPKTGTAITTDPPTYDPDVSGSQP